MIHLESSPLAARSGPFLATAPHCQEEVWPQDRKQTYDAGAPAMYDLLAQQIEAMTEDVADTTANLANVSALLAMALPDINWAGFYVMKEGRLVLGPFQGKPACVTIGVGRGVCGTAVATGQAQWVQDVHQFPGHIACDSASRSEYVLPLFRDGSPVAVLDIDSPYTGRFTAADDRGLRALQPLLERLL